MADPLTPVSHLAPISSGLKMETTTVVNSREPADVDEALADVHRRYCPVMHPHPDADRFHDPVCRILTAGIAELRASLEAKS